MAGMSFEDYVNAYYRGGLDISARYGIKKSDELTTGDAAYFNTMYGASVFNQLNTKSDVFKLFRKEGWTQSGWRVLSARTAAASKNAEVANLPPDITAAIVENPATVEAQLDDQPVEVKAAVAAL